ncbi:type IV secretion system DNA-binding domain-containing protein [Xanthomonas euvesicatoria pv. euvesicatoria]|uniref:type IV secretion system DNA-binding domain-containing protein n=4 Tax=Xanthomonas TaxID=338 RepID=UPI0006996642|nr:type IV secretion system DNA-binding domain-containing protein [Xanthomonas euvesicatoria]MCC8762665.1 type IV secretion system DNA-binding domain-containing protein [Xanthomonas euvesicatoria pv. euvesicatoria]MCC8776521.1 type IV secretion system DNA-binding domain-containing protein [Xanthomonas euvesicatoria pv. euvesicatoria]MDW7704292.1 type IV secretion system DNA-binding domain-containing protein [Xanthomonas euvesicatoria]MDW7720920.1 type IV secretion system DNA-binding domain-cont
MLEGLAKIGLSVVFWVALIAGVFAGFKPTIAAPVTIPRGLYAWFAYNARPTLLRGIWMLWTCAGFGYVARAFLVKGLMAGLFPLIIVVAGSGILTWLHGAIYKGDAARGARTVRGASLAKGSVAAAPSGEYALNVHIGGQVIDHTTEAEHFLISGKTGAGKSQAINAMLRTVRDRSDDGLPQRAIIADPAGGYWQKFARDGDVLLNPFDARSAAWSPFTELREDADCQNMAKAAIPDATGDSQQWHYYAQTLFAEVLRALWHRGTWSNKELLRLIMVADRKELAEVVAGTAAAQLTGKESERMLGNTRSIASTYLNAWQNLPDVGTFSVREWVRESANGPGPWLFLTYRDSQMALMRNLIACWLELAIIEGLELDEDTTGVRRLWYVMDELDSLGKITSLRAGLTKLRKYGGVGVCGLQTIAQLRDRYGREEAQTLLSCLSTKLLLAAGDAETAEYFSKEIGDHAIVRTVRSQNSGSSSGMRWDSGSNSQGESMSEQYATERAVLASQITGLANLQGFLKRVNLAEWVPVAIPYVGMPANLPAYVPRPNAGPAPVAKSAGEG